MGCDGGTIPKRDELVRTKKKKEQKDKTSELNFRWRCCSISQSPLQKPIVACGLGKLFSKDSVITCLLDRSTLPEFAKHIKSLKDVRELNLTPNPAFQVKEETGDGYIDHQSAPFICPIIGLEMNGKFKFVFPWSCGCVVSERAMKELRSDNCHRCQKPVKESDIVILNACDDDMELMQSRMLARQALLKANKKAKKSCVETVKVEPQSDAEESTSKKATALAPVKVLNGDSSLKSNGLKRGESLGMQCPALKKAKTDYSVAKDPDASDVYKSLFTSSSRAKKQDRAHWITYNPFYN